MSASIAIPEFTAATQGSAFLDFGPDGLTTALGIGYAISTTPHTLTFPATSDCFVFARYQ